MTLIKFYDPVQTSFQHEDGFDSFEQLTRNFIPEHKDPYLKKTSVPANIVEDNHAYHIEMALPGVNKKDIKIDHENGILTVHVDRDVHENDTETSYTFREFDYNDASRAFRIGNRIDSGKISATYNNGILSLVLPKREEFVNKPSRSISVK